jgi:hypothetical protein
LHSYCYAPGVRLHAQRRHHARTQGETAFECAIPESGMALHFLSKLLLSINVRRRKTLYLYASGWAANRRASLTAIS